MEKILRKISCLAPPMDRTKTVLCEHWDGKKELGYFGGEWFNMNGDTIAPECWYEEVDLLEAFKDAYKMEFINNAKERYEKAIKDLEYFCKKYDGPVGIKNGHTEKNILLKHYE